MIFFYKEFISKKKRFFFGEGAGRGWRWGEKGE